MSLPVDGWKNVNGTSDRRCNCGSWLQHWINFSGQTWPKKCSVVNCSNPAEVGAHVYNSLASMYEYIVPMCKSCNGKNEPFAIDEGVVKVSANVSETCKKNVSENVSLYFDYYIPK